MIDIDIHEIKYTLDILKTHFMKKLCRQLVGNIKFRDNRKTFK